MQQNPTTPPTDSPSPITRLRRPSRPYIIIPAIVGPIILVLLLAYFSGTGIWQIEYAIVVLLGWSYAAAQQYRTGMVIDSRKQTLTIESAFRASGQPIDLGQIHEVQYEIAYYLSTPTAMRQRRDVFTIFYADTSLVLSEWNDPVYAQNVAIAIAQAKGSDILSQRLSANITSYTFPEAGSNPHAVASVN